LSAIDWDAGLEDGGAEVCLTRFPVIQARGAGPPKQSFVDAAANGWVG
jgi:hypothetical protein